MKAPFSKRCMGFTMIEIMAVVAIIGVLVTLSISALSNTKNSRLTAAGNLLVDRLNFSRQTAITKNCLVEFRIYQLPDPGTSSNSTPQIYRAFQAFALDSVGTPTALGKLTMLPDGVMIASSPSVSSLLETKIPPNYVTGTTDGKTLGVYPPASYNYYSFHFKPNGSTDLSPNSAYSWHLSLALQRDPVVTATGLPANFFTVQVDALNGRVRSFRPN